MCNGLAKNLAVAICTGQRCSLIKDVPLEPLHLRGAALERNHEIRWVGEDLGDGNLTSAQPLAKTLYARNLGYRESDFGVFPEIHAVAHCSPRMNEKPRMARKPIVSSSKGAR